MQATKRTSTFNFLLKNPPRPTVEEFRSEPKLWEKRLKIQLNLFSHLLIYLWTPIQKDETENFIPILFVDKTKYFSEKKLLIKSSAKNSYPSESVPTDLLHNFIHSQKIHNFGVLLFLNIFFQAKEFDSNYKIRVSQKTGKLYFSQSYKQFFQSHFSKQTHQNLQFQQALSHPNIQKITGMKKMKHFFQIHFQEMALLYLHLYLTPWALIEKLALYFIKDFPESLSMINNFKISFYTHLETLERILTATCPKEWEDFLKNNLKDPTINFTATIKKFIQTAPFLNEKEIELIGHEITHYSLQLNVPNLNYWCYPQSLKFLPLGMYITCFNYLQRKSLDYWDAIKNNSNHVVWQELEQLTRFLLSTSIQESPQLLDLSHALFLKAITFNFVNIVLFYIKLGGNLKNLRLNFFLNKDQSLKPLTNKIAFVIALEYQNQFIAQQLQIQYNYLNEYEKDFIKQILQKFVLSNNFQAFLFTTSICPSICEDRFFLEHIRRLCHETSQDFLKYIPLKPINTKKLSPKAMSMLNTESDSDCSSSSTSSDEYHVRFRFFNDKPREPATLEEIFQRFPNLQNK